MNAVNTLKAQYLDLLHEQTRLGLAIMDLRIRLAGEVAVLECKLCDASNPVEVQAWWQSVVRSFSLPYVAEAVGGLDERGARLWEFMEAVELAGTFELEKVFSIIDKRRGGLPAGALGHSWNN